MKSMTIKGVPDALYQELRRRAKAHRRSLNSEVLVSLEQLLPLAHGDVGARLDRLDGVREKLNLPYMTDAELGEARRGGLEPSGLAVESPGQPHVRFDQAAIEALCHRHRIRRLSLFGSVLRDDFTGGSDVDVLIEFAPGHAVGFDLVTIEDELSGLFGGRRVHLSLAKYLKPELRARVLAEASELHAEG